MCEFSTNRFILTIYIFLNIFPDNSLTKNIIRWFQYKNNAIKSFILFFYDIVCNFFQLIYIYIYAQFSKYDKSFYNKYKYLTILYFYLLLILLLYNYYNYIYFIIIMYNKFFLLNMIFSPLVSFFLIFFFNKYINIKLSFFVNIFFILYSLFLSLNFYFMVNLSHNNFYLEFFLVSQDLILDEKTFTFFNYFSEKNIIDFNTNILLK
jgi:hypothetical protein